MNHQCQFCLENSLNRDKIIARKHGIHIELINENNKWFLSTYSVQTEELPKKINVYCGEFQTETIVKYCPWCGRKLK